MEFSARAKHLAKIFELSLVNSLLPQCVQTVALEMVQQYAGACPDCPRLAALSALRVYTPAHGEPSSCLCHQIECTLYAACVRI